MTSKLASVSAWVGSKETNQPNTLAKPWIDLSTTCWYNCILTKPIKRKKNTNWRCSKSLSKTFRKKNERVYCIIFWIQRLKFLQCFAGCGFQLKSSPFTFFIVTLHKGFLLKVVAKYQSDDGICQGLHCRLAWSRGSESWGSSLLRDVLSLDIPF